jgi:hypothetical protein
VTTHSKRQLVAVESIRHLHRIRDGRHRNNRRSHARNKEVHEAGLLNLIVQLNLCDHSVDRQNAVANIRSDQMFWHGVMPASTLRGGRVV